MSNNHPNRSPSSPARRPDAEQIREARLRANLTQESAADLVYSGRRTWQDWELGVANMHPGLWELFRIKTSQV